MRNKILEKLFNHCSLIVKVSKFFSRLKQREKCLKRAYKSSVFVLLLSEIESSYISMRNKMKKIFNPNNSKLNSRKYPITNENCIVAMQNKSKKVF